MSSNGHPAPPRPFWARMPRRARLAFGLVTALVIGTTLIVPVVFRNGPGGSPCGKTFQFQDVTYTARTVPASSFVQSLPIGTAVATGCGTETLNDVDVRSVAGLRSTLAIAVPTDDTSIYVRKGVCAAAAPAGVMACLRRS